MLERINVISRNEIDRAYKDHVFFKLIRILCQPYVVSLKNFHLLPEDKIKLSSVNDTLTRVLSKDLNEYDGDYLAVKRFMQSS